MKLFINDPKFYIDGKEIEGIEFSSITVDPGEVSYTILKLPEWECLDCGDVWTWSSVKYCLCCGGEAITNNSEEPPKEVRVLGGKEGL